MYFTRKIIFIWIVSTFFSLIYGIFELIFIHFNYLSLVWFTPLLVKHYLRVPKIDLYSRPKSTRNSPVISCHIVSPTNSYLSRVPCSIYSLQFSIKPFVLNVVLFLFLLHFFINLVISIIHQFIFLSSPN